jgi:hypothetical protein
MIGVSNRVARPKVLNFMRLLLDGDTFKASGLVDRIAFLTMDFVHGYHCLGPPGHEPSEFQSLYSASLNFIVLRMEVTKLGIFGLGLAGMVSALGAAKAFLRFGVAPAGPGSW